MPAKIAVNGYGTIGKRVADAVASQDDMRLAGVAKTKPDFEAKLAVRKGYAVYAANKDALAKFEKAGIKAAGILDDLVREVDLVVDCTPEDSGYKPLYEKAGVKAIWQGGEEHSLTNLSFNAAANYADCLGAPFVRVPSCNTTGLIRTLYPLDAHVGVEKVLAVMVRRATDPGDSKKGPINAIEPELEMPSHHGPDVQSVLPDLDIHTIAVKVDDHAPAHVGGGPQEVRGRDADPRRLEAVPADHAGLRRRWRQVHGPDHGDGPRPVTEPFRPVRDCRVARRRARRRRQTPVLFPGGPPGVGCRARERRRDPRDARARERRPQEHGEDGPVPRHRDREMSRARPSLSRTRCRGFEIRYPLRSSR